MNHFKIKTVDEFWTWSIEKLAFGQRANTWYNGQQPYGLAGFLNDFSSRMVGYATLRQLRVRNSKPNLFAYFKKYFRILMKLKN